MIVLDTHAWLWLGLEPGRLSAAAGAAIKQALGSGGLAISSISLWETAAMIARGVVTPMGTPEAWLSRFVEATGIVVKEITPTVATLAAHFPREFPADPSDRLIAATARAEGMPLITRDARLRASRLVETVW